MLFFNLLFDYIRYVSRFLEKEPKIEFFLKLYFLNTNIPLDIPIGMFPIEVRLVKNNGVYSSEIDPPVLVKLTHLKELINKLS